ncbi:MAG: NAD(P)/FAD-dependent oxidoreductase [Akkermansiaceae bacterium]|nr:NAD(P)/FAD-dependent oxidoreductase [Armatimonadota bacterium]
MIRNQGLETASGVAPDYDAIIVGGSYAGLSAAIQLARARRRILVIDAGKPRNRFARASHGFFGQDGQSPKEMIERARKQVLAYPTVRFEQAEATRATREGDGFRVTFGDNRVARARRLVLATGVKDDLPAIPGMKELWGTGVAHCPYCHGYEVAGRKIAILSGKELGVHQALLLRDWSDDVTLLINGAGELGSEDSERLQARRVKIETVPVSRLIANGSELEAVEFADGKRLPFGAMFIATRYSLASPLAEQLGCEIEQGAFGPTVKTDDFKKSSVPGVYVAGDAGRAMHSATLASADGVLAGVGAHQSLIFAK